jgi:uncharacterized membrane protein YfcA
VDGYLITTIAALCFLLAGTVKGVVGIGLPTTAIGVMTLWIDPRVAIALTLLPMTFSNAWQVIRQGHIGRTMRTYRVFAVVLFFGVGATTLLSKDVPQQVLTGILGTIIIVFSLVNLIKDFPALPARFDRVAQISMGLFAGVMGGLTAVWGPAMIMYLTATRKPKDEFVRATGFLIFVGSIPLLLGYIRNGFFTADIAWIGALMLIPTLAGFTLGEALRSRMSGEVFRKTLLYVFLLLGLNLLRRSIF